MPYILFHTIHGPMAYIDAPAHSARPETGQVIIPCDAGANVNDREHWAEAHAEMQRTGMPAPTPALTYAYLNGLFSEKIQERLDAFAQTPVTAAPGVTYAMYDDIRSAISYAYDPNPVFAMEGRCAQNARSATWSVANAILAAVMAGTRDIPSWEDVEAELPVLQWPEGSRGAASANGAEDTAPETVPEPDDENEKTS